MTATIEIRKTIGRPIYEATIRKGPTVLWSQTFKVDFVALAATQRKLSELRGH